MTHFLRSTTMSLISSGLKLFQPSTLDKYDKWRKYTILVSMSGKYFFDEGKAEINEIK